MESEKRNGEERLGLTVIIPAYNEEKRLAETVREHHAYLWEHRDCWPKGVELLIVVNGSTDRTGEIARALDEELALVRAWETSSRLGKGGAVFQGFRLARGSVVAFCDADNSTVPAQLRLIVDAIQSGADVGIGTRWAPGSVQVIRQPLVRRIASRIFNLIVRILFGLPYTDTQCGAKAFKYSALEPLLESEVSSGWAFDVELLWRLRNSGAEIAEIPIEWRDGSGSRLRMHRDGPQMLLELLKIRLRK